MRCGVLLRSGGEVIRWHSGNQNMSVWSREVFRAAKAKRCRSRVDPRYWQIDVAPYLFCMSGPVTARRVLLIVFVAMAFSILSTTRKPGGARAVQNMTAGQSAF